MDREIAGVPYTQNRELSWLKFNERVLEEAEDPNVPLLEQLKFISIFSSNLDEFFMIRVGSLNDLSLIDEKAIDDKSGMTAGEQLEKIYAAVPPLYEKKDVLYKSVERDLRKNGLFSLKMSELESGERKYVKQYFSKYILPVLSPQIVDSHHPFPHIQNKVLNIAAYLKVKGEPVLGLIPVPQILPDIVMLPGEDVRYVCIEKIIMEYVDEIFSMYKIVEKTVMCVTRNADINPEDEGNDTDADFRDIMKKLLHKRKRMAVVRLETSEKLSRDFEKYLCEKLQIGPEQIFVVKSPITMQYVYSLFGKIGPEQKERLVFSEYRPRRSPDILPGESIFQQIQRKDVLFSYPYESMDAFLQMIREAAYDPAVVSIKITIYRLASRARLVEYLCDAAENGKEIVVLIELRARFDEQNNIDWSERLEEAGCTVVYGIEGFKVHAKICLITREDKSGLAYITQVGTGNYNENTAELYADLSLVTRDPGIAAEANEFFRNMLIGNLNGEYQKLMVAPNSFKSRIMGLIEGEIRKGSSGRITMKLNSVTDIDIIRKLRDASCAGVQIRMIVRGICCLLPGVPGNTENITVISIVGRYLEHVRIYSFGTGVEQKLFISSADMMTRNTQRRVEVACPVFDEEIKSRINKMLEAEWYDNIKARILTKDGAYVKKDDNRPPVDSQQYLMNETAERALRPRKQENGFGRLLNKIKSLFGGRPERAITERLR